MEKEQLIAKKKLHFRRKYFSFVTTFCYLMLFSLAYSGCKKDDTTNQPPNEYYIKYIISSSTIYIGGKINLTITDEKNRNVLVVINQNSKTETIIGPVTKGFLSYLSAAAIGQTHNKLKLSAEIQVSKNKSPFAIKASNSSEIPRNMVALNYTIDY